MLFSSDCEGETTSPRGLTGDSLPSLKQPRGVREVSDVLYKTEGLNDDMNRERFREFGGHRVEDSPRARRGTSADWVRRVPWVPRKAR